MDTIADYVRSVEGRVLGRVFTYQDRLHFVLEADRQTGLARMSCRYGLRTDIIYMPVTEVVTRLEEEMRRQTAAAAPKRHRGNS
jgi:hypothetical protein